MRIISLMGWGQPADSLRLAGVDAVPHAYDAHEEVEHALQALANHAKSYDVVIGWSLGGQLASMAIAKGYMKPEKLVLIASPFQFVQSASLSLGMPRTQFHTFRDNYKRSPKRTLDKAWGLVIKDDIKAEQLRNDHLQHGKEDVLQQNWQSWLEHLDELSCHDLPFDHFPPTLILHGNKDVVVRMEQSEHYAKVLPNTRLVTFEGCAHAPHWHDPKRAEQVIKEFIGV